MNSTKADTRSGAAGFSFKSNECTEKKKEVSENAVNMILIFFDVRD